MSNSEQANIKLKQKIVIEAFKKFHGSQKLIHSFLCEISGKQKDSVNKSSLYSRVKRTYNTAKRLQHARNLDRYMQF